MCIRRTLTEQTEFFTYILGIKFEILKKKVIRFIEIIITFINEYLIFFICSNNT